MEATGRRERRRLQTRHALADAALELFEAHGYDGTTVAEIADKADVALATLFKHVPDGKPAVMFDDGEERRTRIVAAVRDRAPDERVLKALHGFIATRGAFNPHPPPKVRRIRHLIMTTPALAGYQRKLWLTAEGPLLTAIADTSKVDPTDPAVRALVRYVLEVPEIAGTDPNPRQALTSIFDRLQLGWPEL